MFRKRFESKFNFRTQFDRLMEPGRGVPCKWQSRYLEVKQGHMWEFPHYNNFARTNHTPLLTPQGSVPPPACASPPRSISIAVFAFVPLVLRERERERCGAAACRGLSAFHRTRRRSAAHRSVPRSRRPETSPPARYASWSVTVRVLVTSLFYGSERWNPTRLLLLFEFVQKFPIFVGISVGLPYHLSGSFFGPRVISVFFPSSSDMLTRNTPVIKRVLDC